MSSSILSDIRRIPPVTRFLSGSLLGVSMLYMLEIVSHSALIYRFHAVLQSYQVWRLYTSFFVGSGGLFFLFELLMLYHTSNQLESGYDSADLAWQLFFACVAIMVPSHLLATMIFLHPLIHCIAYLLSARTPADESLSSYGFITLPAKYLPHCHAIHRATHRWSGSCLSSTCRCRPSGTAGGELSGVARRVLDGQKAPKWSKNLGSRVMNGCEKVADGIAKVFQCCRRGDDHNWGSGQALLNA
ncbi:Der1-like family-domain-containing protein [Armillaria borealis]|uniref:Derlin n=1 Tax=Armillaria borealis TaxID=47425 RepID=A0AA39JN19_9AGAR|nr:Der1-like family-domain-containing protein [Armillaria borealis]